MREEGGECSQEYVNFVLTEMDSFECWSLSESGHHLVEELGMLVGNPEGVCQR